MKGTATTTQRGEEEGEHCLSETSCATSLIQSNLPKDMMYNDCFDPDINFLNLRRAQGVCNYYNEVEFNQFSSSILEQGHFPPQHYTLT